MNRRLKKLAVTLTITAILLNCTQTRPKLAFSGNTGGKIDLFTQKEPFNGKGLNISSDAFDLGEEVVIYALVTYNDYPEQMASVAFEVHGPENPVQNITFYDYAQTNESGIAKINFRTGLISEINFGEWKAVGNVDLAGRVLQDFISFEVGWIVEIVSIKTVNENYVEQTNFMKNSFVGIELTLRNIAMTEKSATLAITIYDSLNILIDSAEINDFVVQPNGTLVYAHWFLFIPKSTLMGRAVAYACAYTAPLGLGGVPYCPKVSKHFLILNRDIAILKVQPSPTVVDKGETVKIDVNVKNKGEEFESFSVTTYYNETLIGTLSIIDLQPSLNATISFTWNTSLVQEGFYQISAYAEPVPGEINVLDNNFTNGVVEVKSLVRDVAVLSVTPSTKFAYVGEIINVYVVAKNEGGQAESFNVTVYYDSNVVGTLFVDRLMPNDTKMLVFHWNTSDVLEDNYTLSALASIVPGEENFGNNLYVDGTVAVAVAPKGWFVAEWLWRLLLLLLILITILLVIWLYRRKKRKETREAFYSGWTAWYYGYDLRKKLENQNPKQECNITQNI